MGTSVTFGFIDDATGKGYRSISLDADVTAAAAKTFADTLVGYSDNGLDSISLKSTNYYVVDPNTLGPTEVEKIGYVVLKDTTTVKGRYTIPIQGISQANIVKGPKGIAPTLTDALCADVLTQFAVFSGIAEADLKVIDSFVQEK